MQERYGMRVSAFLLLTTLGTNKYGVAEDFFDQKRCTELSIIHETLLQACEQPEGYSSTQSTQLPSARLSIPSLANSTEHCPYAQH